MIFLERYRKAKTNNPLFYFGSAGVASTAAGIGMGALVLYRYLAFGISHEVIAVGAVGATILGIQLLVFGVLADMIHSLHREQIARYERALSDGATEASAAADGDGVRVETDGTVGSGRTTQTSGSEPDDVGGGDGRGD